jgi:tRNA pseudouridine38-40 synthase
VASQGPDLPVRQAGVRGRRLALVLEYDGRRYGGSQYQKNAPSIQGELEAALNKLTGENLRTAFAGRTDAGVHARGQVASFVTGSRHEPETFVRGLNYWLPADIAVQRALEVRLDFDVRRRARSREYRYLVLNSPLPSPLLQAFTWQVAEQLDAEAMREAASSLVGRHDFAAFAGPVAGSTVRSLHRCGLDTQGRLLFVHMKADAFLPHQVRRTVGALVQVGLGRQSAADLAALLREPQPGVAGPAAAPQGLCLMKVNYPGLDLSPLDGWEGPPCETAT